MPAPPKAGFNKRPPKPGPNFYWNGSRWVRSSGKPGPPVRPGAGRPSGRPARSPGRPAQNWDDWAAQQAQRRVDAEVEAIRAQQSAYEREMQANYQRRLDQAKGLSEYIAAQGFDKRIQGIYSAAGSDLAGLASGFAGDTRDIANADAAEQMNILSGTGQEGAVRNQGTNMGDVTYGVGGWIPSKSLGEQGAAYAADAALQPAFTLQYGMEDASNILQEGQAGLSDFALAIAEAQAGKYSYKEELLAERRAMSLQQQKLRLTQLENDRQFWLDRQALLLSQKKYKLAAQAEKRANAIARRINYESQGRDYQGNLMPGYTLGPQGQVIPPNHRVDKNGNIVRVYAGDGKNKPKYTPAQQASMIETIVQKEEDIQSDIATAVRAGEWTPSSGNAKDRAALGRRLWNQYKHLAGTYKPAQARLRAIIRRLLNEASKIGPPVPGSGTSPPSNGTSPSGSIWDN